MGAPIPQVLLEAIANSAPAGTSPGDKTEPMPDAPPGANFASIQAGFPANTMQSEVAGGLPPFGQDMNGFLFLISSHTLYVECGQLYQFDSALASAIGGYLAGSILGMADGTGIWMCTTNGNTNNPDTGGAGWIPLASYGKTTKAVTGGVVALTANESKYNVIILTGVLVSNLSVQLPQNTQEWLIVNATTGAFTTTVLTAASGSVGVQVPQGGLGAPTGVYSIGDGNIYPTASPLGFTISVAPTPSTVVQRSNLGFVLATFFNMSGGVDNSPPATVITNNGDGTLRQNTLTNFESFLLLQAMGGQVTNGQVPYSVVQQWVATFLNNAALTGTPTAPTAASGASNTQIANTQFVNPSSNLTGAGPWWRQNPDGSIVQWGTFSYTTHTGAHLISYGRSFPAAIQTVEFSEEAATIGWDTWIVAGSKGLNSFQINDDAPGANAVTINWRATGR